MKNIPILIASLLLACHPAAAPSTDRCSSVALATVMAGCEVRIRLECVTGDKDCAVYQACKAAIKTWRQCPEAP